MLFFSLLVVVVFSFPFDPNAEESRQIAGGLIWVAFLFAAVVALNQTWARGKFRNQVLDAYRVSPAPANSLFSRKLWAILFLSAVLEALMTPLFVVFYHLRQLGRRGSLLIVAVLGTWALVVNGTFFAAMSSADAQPRNHAAAAPVPHFHSGALGMVQATTGILMGEETARFWMVLLVTYDWCLLSLSLLLI